MKNVVEYIDNHVVKKECRDKRQEREQSLLLSCLVLFLTWVFESGSVLSFATIKFHSGPPHPVVVVVGLQSEPAAPTSTP